MKHLAKRTIVAMVLLGVFGSGLLVHAADEVVSKDDSVNYVTLAPLTKGKEVVDTTKPDEWFKFMFYWFIAIAGTIGVVKIVLSGSKYMFTESVTSKGDAKKDITGVVVGLIIILVSSLLLAIINRDLIASPFERIREKLDIVKSDGGIPTPPVSESSGSGDPEIPIKAGTTKDCTSIKDCG